MSRKTGRRAHFEQIHPDWCNVPRCLSYYVQPIGEHRSRVMAQKVPGVGAVSLTLWQLPGEPTRFDVRISVKTPNDDPRRQAVYAERVLDELVSTVRAMALREQAQAALAAAPDRRQLAAGGGR